jgi:hypothetical protein
MLLPHTRSQGFKIVFQHFHGEFLVAWETRREPRWFVKLRGQAAECSLRPAQAPGYLIFDIDR